MIPHTMLSVPPHPHLLLNLEKEKIIFANLKDDLKVLFQSAKAAHITVLQNSIYTRIQYMDFSITMILSFG